MGVVGASVNLRRVRMYRRRRTKSMTPLLARLALVVLLKLEKSVS